LRLRLKTAELGRFVAGLSEGINAWLGEAGVLLSGGEARRVSIARIACRPSESGGTPRPHSNYGLSGAVLSRDVKRAKKLDLPVRLTSSHIESRRRN
jgi:hypothetical protein